MEIVTTTEGLKRLCQELSRDSFVTVDTEFMREQTFWPELCLIQIAGAEREAIIDPLAEGLSLKPFFDLMANKKVVKVFHAARQDLEIIWLKAKLIPEPIFDTQVAAMVCGFGDQVSYEALARRIAKVQIDKSSRFTDWSRRPLSQKQLAYALSDVIHLRPIYEKLRGLLDKSGREPWLEEELAVLTSPSTYETHPEEAWKRVKFRPRNRKQLAILITLAAWREREAQERNVPRSRILKDDAIAEAATQAPQDIPALKSLRALPRGYATSRVGEAVIKQVAAGLAMDAEQLPKLKADDTPLTETASVISDVLKLALKVICEKEGIAPRIVANSGDLDAIAMDDAADIPLLKGWRRKLFGETALRIKAGEMAIVLENGKPRVLPYPKAIREVKAAE
ncbi:MAG TPA: ribonuclease D [Aestuariivirgaceae bacterium]|nr:ribonuclease D [Aestuariivirgaceae bacterium]